MAALQAVLDDLFKHLTNTEASHAFTYRIYIQPMVRIARIYRLPREQALTLHRDAVPETGSYILVGLHVRTKKVILTYRTARGNDETDTHAAILYSDREREQVLRDAKLFLVDGVVPQATEQDKRESA